MLFSNVTFNNAIKVLVTLFSMMNFQLDIVILDTKKHPCSYCLRAGMLYTGGTSEKTSV